MSQLFYCDSNMFLGPAELLSGRLVQNARWKHQKFTNVISLNYIHNHLRYKS